VALGPIKGSLELRNMEGRLLETLPGFLNSDALIQWQADGKGIFVADTRTVPARVYRFDLRSGRRTLWRQLTPPNPEEAHRLGTIAVAPRGNAYAYSYPRVLSSNLYLMEGAF